jgi:uncharacterized membrane protein
MAFCSACGAELAEGAVACSKCGRAVSVGGGTAAAPYATSTTNSGLADNIAGALSYFFIPAILFLVLEPYNRNRTIRFHAFQGIGLALASILVHIVLGMIPLIGWAFLPFVSLFFLIIAIIGAVKAYQNGRLNIPIISPQAEKMANQ